MWIVGRRAGRFRRVFVLARRTAGAACTGALAVRACLALLTLGIADGFPLGTAFLGRWASFFTRAGLAARSFSFFRAGFSGCVIGLFVAARFVGRISVAGVLRVSCALVGGGVLAASAGARLVRSLSAARSAASRLVAAVIPLGIRLLLAGRGGLRIVVALGLAGAFLRRLALGARFVGSLRRRGARIAFIGLAGA